MVSQHDEEILCSSGSRALDRNNRFRGSIVKNDALGTNLVLICLECIVVKYLKLYLNISLNFLFVYSFFSPQAAAASGTLRVGRRRLSDSWSPSPAPNTLLMSVTGKVTPIL